MGLLMPGDLEKLVEKTRHLLSSSIRQLAAQHPELEIDQILGLKIDNDPHSAALLLAAAKLKLQTVLMASNRIAEYFPLAQKHAGIKVLLENSNDGIRPVHFAEQLQQEEKDSQEIEPFYQKEKDLNRSGFACLFTSGSTAASKLALYKWDALYKQADETLKRSPYLLPNPLTNRVNYQLVAGSPIAHAYSIDAVFVAFQGAVPLGLPDLNNIGGYLEEAVQSEYPAVLMGTPALYEKLLLHAERASQERNINPSQIYSGLKMAYSAGCRLPKEIWQEFRQHHGITIMQNFGTTETGNIALHETPLDNYYLGYVGTPWGEVKIEKTTETIKADSTDQKEVEGELHVHVPWMSSGYVINHRFHPHGHYHPTGDYAAFRTASPQGLILGRRIRKPILVHIKKDAENSAIQIDPHVIESQMKENNEIVDCVAIQLQDGGIGIFVTLAKKSLLNPDDLQVWWKTHHPEMPSFAGLKILTQLPKSPAGKIIYRNLDDTVLRN